MKKQTIEQFLLQQYSSQTVKTYLFNINHFLKLNPKAKRYKYQNILDYMEEISKKQSNPKYRVVILSAIKKYYDYLVMCISKLIESYFLFEIFSEEYIEG